ncbi:MAG: cupredoxin family protein [Hyphomicrobiales bacterium]|nr:cupredoxin family protein [Hyphomicrobiales bacterium]MDE2115025.1 cupredoxin family protein [Hyphomicrobiales bacterium]
MIPWLAPMSMANEAGHHHDELSETTVFGEPGNAKLPTKVVQLTMTDQGKGMAFTPQNITLHQGDQVKFIVHNEGALDHEMMLATKQMNDEHALEMVKNPDMEHDQPNALRLKPGARGKILWHFTKAGEFDFSCLIPGHREAGMQGKVTVIARQASK